MGEEFNKREDR